MGIRFYCPNGHKLNVKEFQAGRKAVCPYCGTKTQIPRASTRKSSRQEKAERRALRQGGVSPLAPTALPPDAALMGGADMVGIAARAEPDHVAAGNSSPAAAIAASVGFETTPAAEEPLAAAADAWPSDAVPASVFYGGPAHGPAAQAESDSPSVAGPEAVAGAAGPVAAPSGAAPAGAGDPLAEAGDGVWYVRPSSGGQFGPADRDVMRTWLAEGRVNPDALVWREGWRDWQEAATVFPQLASRPSAYGLDTLLAIEMPPPSATPQTFRAASRRQFRRTQATIVIGLLVALIILFAVLLWIWFHEGEAPAEQPAARGAAVLRFDPIRSLWPSAVRPHSA